MLPPRHKKVLNQLFTPDHSTISESPNTTAEQFFCHEPPEQAEALYEPFHQRIRALHDRLELPYLYVELSGALAELLPPDE